jgi:hypothetical protein
MRAFLSLPEKGQEPYVGTPQELDGMYLVHFFDHSGTWSWVAKDQMRLLGCETTLDEAMLKSNKKKKVGSQIKVAFALATDYLSKNRRPTTRKKRGK